MRANETTERARAEALFKKQEQLREGAKAMAEYETAQQAIREKTATLRALRLERDAANRLFNARLVMKPRRYAMR